MFKNTKEVKNEEGSRAYQKQQAKYEHGTEGS